MIQIFEENYEVKKKYLRGELIFVRNHILTSTFCDTIHFMEEINLFDSGNDQNRYLDVTEYKSTKNLKLKYDGNTDVSSQKHSLAECTESLRSHLPDILWQHCLKESLN